MAIAARPREPRNGDLPRRAGARPGHRDRRTAPTLNAAVIQLDFDPLLGIGSLAVPWASVALAAALLGAILVWSHHLGAAAGSRPSEDVLYVLLGIIPGALVGGRLVHVVTFPDVYVDEPGALFDLSRGAISLLGAVLGGGLAGAYVCRLLGHGVARWADTAALPLLIVIGLGKLALVLAGSGQGAPFDGPWAIAFEGPGPWVSADPATPAHPSQLYEGLWTLAGILVLGWRRRVGPSTVAGGSFLLAVAWWLAGRTLAGFTWRDEPLIGPLVAEHLMAAVALLLVIVVLAITARKEAAVR